VRHSLIAWQARLTAVQASVLVAERHQAAAVTRRAWSVWTRANTLQRRACAVAVAYNARRCLTMWWATWGRAMRASRWVRQYRAKTLRGTLQQWLTATVVGVATRRGRMRRALRRWVKAQQRNTRWELAAAQCLVATCQRRVLRRWRRVRQDLDMARLWHALRLWRRACHRAQTVAVAPLAPLARPRQAHHVTLLRSFVAQRDRRWLSRCTGFWRQALQKVRLAHAQRDRHMLACAWAAWCQQRAAKCGAGTALDLRARRRLSSSRAQQLVHRYTVWRLRHNALLLHWVWRVWKARRAMAAATSDYAFVFTLPPM
jgi:hypothetical protein